MTNKLALTASVITLIAISGAAVAGSPKTRTPWSAASFAAQAAYYPYPFEPAAPWPVTGPNVRRYHGGPKSDY
jgi:hypothetical protein